MTIFFFIFQIFVQVSLQNNNFTLDSFQPSRDLAINYNSFANLRLQTILYEKINEKYNSDLQYQIIFQLKYTILPIIQNYVYEAFKVQPYTQNIQLNQYEQCNTGITHYDKFYINIGNVDLILIVQLEYKQSVNIMARSKFCMQDSNGRPLVGYIVINAAKFNTDLSYLQDNIFVILHELTHIMCFNKNLYNKFIDPSTGQSYTYQVLQTIDDKQYMVTPNVKAQAQYQFNCSSLLGMRLEDFDEYSKNNNNHWKKSWLNNEFMTYSQSTNKMFISKITLALFDDSGWYQTNQTFAQNIIWGYQMGCDFLDPNKYQNFAEQFCLNKKTGCTFDHVSMGQCIRQEAMDNHSIIQQIQTCKRESTDQRLTEYFSTKVKYIFGWQFQQKSLCFEQTNITLKTKYNIDQLFSCYEAQCDADNNLIISIDGQQQKCEIGKTLYFDTANYHGNLVCPLTSYCPFNQYNFCEDGCNNSGLCLGNGKCICSTMGQFYNCNITLQDLRIFGFLILAIFYVII